MLLFIGIDIFWSIEVILSIDDSLSYTVIFEIINIDSDILLLMLLFSWVDVFYSIEVTFSINDLLIFTVIFEILIKSSVL